MPRRACVLYTGGKDSTYALLHAIRDGLEASCILVVRAAREDSWMFHTANIHLSRLAVKAMGLEDRLVEVEVSGVKEREVEELAAHLEALHRSRGFDYLVVGAVASRYQRKRVEAIASRLGVEVYAPQWGMDPEEYMHRLVAEGLVFVLTSITTYGLPPRLLGVPIDSPERVKEIIALARRYGFHPAFEGGEAETLAVHSPLHRAWVCLRGRRVSLGEFEHRLAVEEAWLGGRDGCIVVDGEVLA